MLERLERRLCVEVDLGTGGGILRNRDGVGGLDGGSGARLEIGDGRFDVTAGIGGARGGGGVGAGCGGRALVARGGGLVSACRLGDLELGDLGFHLVQLVEDLLIGVGRGAAREKRPR